MRKRTSARPVLPLFVFVTLMSMLMATGCQPRNQFIPPPLAKVTVAKPVERPVQDYFYTTGQTRAVSSVELRARVIGYLKEIRFKDGDQVKKDQVLFVIDQAPYQAIVDSAKAALEKSRAQLLLAEQELARTEVLARENAATASKLDLQSAQRSVAVADVTAAEAALRQAQLDLDYTFIRAPFDGRIGRHLVDLGNLISSGQTVLASLESVDPIFAYFNVSEQDLLNFIERQKTGSLPLLNDSDPIDLELALGNSDNFLFKGTLDYREFGINPRTGTTDRRAVFPNSGVSLVPGLFCRLRAPMGPPRNRLLVDERAVQTDQRGHFLTTVNSKNIVELKFVKIGTLDKGLRVIESGLNPDDLVVINGLQRARPDATVEPTETSMLARLEQEKNVRSRDASPEPEKKSSEKDSKDSPDNSR